MKSRSRGTSSGQPVATSGAAAKGKELVADELAAVLREDRRTVGETCARYYWLLLAEGHLTRERFGSMLKINNDRGAALA